MSDYSELLEDLRSKWLFPRSIEAADLIERLIRERDEARAREKTARALLEDAETMLLKCEHREKQARAGYTD